MVMDGDGLLEKNVLDFFFKGGNALYVASAMPYFLYSFISIVFLLS